MFDPQKLFPIVRKSITKGTDAQVLQALEKLAKAHPELSEVQALAALQAYMQKKGGNNLSSYLGGNKK